MKKDYLYPLGASYNNNPTFLLYEWQIAICCSNNSSSSRSSANVCAKKLERNVTLSRTSTGTPSRIWECLPLCYTIRKESPKMSMEPAIAEERNEAGGAVSFDCIVHITVFLDILWGPSSLDRQTRTPPSQFYPVQHPFLFLIPRLQNMTVPYKIIGVVNMLCPKRL